MNEVTLSPDSVKAVAAQLAEILRPTAINADPLFDRKGAADYLTITVRTFDRERVLHPKTLMPAGECGPMARRWRKSTLDQYKYGARAFVRTRNRKAA